MVGDWNAFGCLGRARLAVDLARLAKVDLSPATACRYARPSVGTSRGIDDGSVHTQEANISLSRQWSVWIGEPLAGATISHVI